MAKFTFKKDPKITGLASVGHREGADIKYKGKKVGRLSAPQWNSRNNLWGIRFTALKTYKLAEGENCPWYWITLKQTFDSEKQCRDFLKEIDADQFVRVKNIICTNDY